MTDRNLDLALRIHAMVDGADSIEDLRRAMGGLTEGI